jgi:RNA polymerase sigma factor (sigma-70 family)
VNPTALPSPGRDEPTLRDLSARAGEGDHDAFEQLHRRIGAGLRRLLLRRSNGREDLVDDLCQKTWSSVWKALSEGKYDPERSAITTFVYAVANNAWMSHLRGFARDQGYVAGAPAMLPGEHAEQAACEEGLPDEVWAHAETLECVRACLREGGVGGLTDSEREVVRAVAGGESDRGLARRLGLSSSTVNIRKHAGYAKIREYLRSRGILKDAEGSSEAGGAGRMRRGMDRDSGPSGMVGTFLERGKLALAGIAGRLP